MILAGLLVGHIVVCFAAYIAFVDRSFSDPNAIEEVASREMAASQETGALPENPSAMALGEGAQKFFYGELTETEYVVPLPPLPMHLKIISVAGVLLFGSLLAREVWRKPARPRR